MPEVLEVLEDAIDLLKFSVVNKDKFTEHDPDGVKKRWIELAEQTIKAAQHSVQADEAICNRNHNVYESVTKPGYCVVCNKPLRR